MFAVVLSMFVGIAAYVFGYIVGLKDGKDIAALRSAGRRNG